MASSNDNFYLKPTEAVRPLLRKEELRPPYDGAKEYFYIADVDDHDYLSKLVVETCKVLPAPKQKRKKCQMKQLSRCVFDDDVCNRIVEKLNEADALIVGSPVYYGQPNGAVMAVLQRAFFSGRSGAGHRGYADHAHAGRQHGLAVEEDPRQRPARLS